MTRVKQRKFWMEAALKGSMLHAITEFGGRALIMYGFPLPRPKAEPTDWNLASYMCVGLAGILGCRG
jgi:hypothetical protein